MSQSINVTDTDGNVLSFGLDYDGEETVVTVEVEAKDGSFWKEFKIDAAGWRSIVAAMAAATKAPGASRE